MLGARGRAFRVPLGEVDIRELCSPREGMADAAEHFCELVPFGLSPY